MCFCTSSLGLKAQPSTFKHVATATNTTSNYTEINHERLNNQANMVLFITHDYSPSGPYLKAPLGVWYTPNKKWSVFTQDRTPMPKGAKFNVLIRSIEERDVFIHTAQRGNISSHITTINNTTTNNNPDAKIIVTQNWGSNGKYNANAVGVYYSGGKWRIFNQNKKPIPEGARFNIMVDHPQSFTTSASTPSNHIHYIDNGRTNNKPNAFVFATQNWGTSGPYNEHTVGVWYSSNKWSIYNEDRAKLPNKVKFNVVAFTQNIPPPRPVISAFKHQNTPSNTSSNSTYLTNPLTNNKPNKVLFITHDYSSGPYITPVLGVWYNAAKWAIFNQDKSMMPKNAKFNVLAKDLSDPGVFIHEAKAGNISGHITTINHPLSNNKPNAKLIVTQNWKNTGPYNNNAIGIYYSGGKWRIFNQNKKPLPQGAKFNIYVSNQTFTATASNPTNHIHNIHNAKTNGKPNNFIFATQNWGTSGPYNEHTIGIWYANGKWTVYNEDRTKLPKNVKFNILSIKQ